jgi:hypothetical protein
MIPSPHRRVLRATLAACAVLAGACAPGGPSTGPGPDAWVDAAAVLGPAAWSAESPAVEIADWVQRGCRRAPGGKDPCVERTLVGLIDQAGVAKSMEVLETLLRVDVQVRQNGHELAHGMGIAAYRTPETMAATFAACPPTQGAGCHHGVVQGYFLSLRSDGRLPGTAELDALCEPHRASIFLYAQCAHGMGHGLMAVHDNHVPMSLEACDQATDGYVREACWGGIFMENIVRVTHPHHTTEGHAATGNAHGGDDAGDEDDAHAGHGPPGGPGMIHGEWKALDPADPLYPCNAVDPRYQQSCYTMQTGAILFFNRGNVDATARACEGAPEAMLPTCFGSLGRDIIAIAEMDHRRTLALCARAGERAAGRGGVWCMVGAVQNLVNLAADPDEGMRFCREVTAEAHKRACYQAVGELVLTLVAEPARGASCEAAEPAFIAACRVGARLASSEQED